MAVNKMTNKNTKAPHPGAKIRESFIELLVKDHMFFTDEYKEVKLLLNNLLQNRGKITEALAYLLEEITNIKASYFGLTYKLIIINLKND